MVRAARSDGIGIPSALSPGNEVKSSNLAGIAFAKGETRYISSLCKKKRLGPSDLSLRQAGLESLLAIPLSGKEATQGVLLLGETRPAQFGSQDAFAIEKIAAQMAVALENARLYEGMRNLFINTIASLANAIDAKSAWTKGHSERVMHIAVNIAEEMGFEQAIVERVRLGGLLHDIGKIGIIEALLEKPASLSVNEFPRCASIPKRGLPS